MYKTVLERGKLLTGAQRFCIDVFRGSGVVDRLHLFDLGIGIKLKKAVLRLLDDLPAQQAKLLRALQRFGSFPPYEASAVMPSLASFRDITAALPGSREFGLLIALRFALGVEEIFGHERLELCRELGNLIGAYMELRALLSARPER